MIEKVEKTDLDAETDVLTPGENLGSRKYSITAKSLMEDEDEEDQEDPVLMSRNPSLVDSDENHQEQSSDQNERNGPSHLDWKREQGEIVNSEPVVVCASSEVIPMCQGDLSLLPGCQGQSLAEQIDFVTQCQPFEIFTGFHEHFNHQDQDVVDHNLLPGMYSIPRECEYCGANDTDYCASDCQRPKSFFRKKRPPFCPPNVNQWEPVTDYEAARSKKASSRETIAAPQQPEIRQTSFLGLGDLFRKRGRPAGECP